VTAANPARRSTRPVRAGRPVDGMCRGPRPRSRRSKQPSGNGRAPASPRRAWAARARRYLGTPRAWPAHRGHMLSSPCRWPGQKKKTTSRRGRGGGPRTLETRAGPRRSPGEQRFAGPTGNRAEVDVRTGSAPGCAAAARRPGLGCRFDRAVVLLEVARATDRPGEPCTRRRARADSRSRSAAESCRMPGPRPVLGVARLTSRGCVPRHLGKAPVGWRRAGARGHVLDCGQQQAS